MPRFITLYTQEYGVRGSDEFEICHTPRCLFVLMVKQLYTILGFMEFHIFLNPRMTFRNSVRYAMKADILSQWKLK